MSQSFRNEYPSRRLGRRKENLGLRQFLTNIKKLLMTLLIAQIQSPQMSRSTWIGGDQLIRRHAMHAGPEALHQVFQRRIVWIKMSQSHYWGWRLRFETSRYINAMMLHLLVPRVGELNIRRVNEVEKIGRKREVERIEGVSRVEEAITEIRKIRW